MRDLNTLYRGSRAFYELDFDPSGFEWIDCNDTQRSVISFLRRGRDSRDVLLFVCNFTPVPRHNYRVGAPSGGYWKEVLNSDAPLYGGSGQGNIGGVEANPLAAAWAAAFAEHHGSALGDGRLQTGGGAVTQWEPVLGANVYGATTRFRVWAPDVKTRGGRDRSARARRGECMR